MKALLGLAAGMLLASTASHAFVYQVTLQGVVSQVQTWVPDASSCVGQGCTPGSPAHLADVATFRGYTSGAYAQAMLRVDSETLQVVATEITGAGLPSNVWNPWLGGSPTGPQARLTPDTLSIDGWLVSGSQADYRFTHVLTFPAGFFGQPGALAMPGEIGRIRETLSDSRMGGCDNNLVSGCVNVSIHWERSLGLVVPEPGTAWTFALGLAGLVAVKARRRAARA